MVTSKKTKKQNNQRRIYLMFTFSERHVTMCHYNDKRSNDVTAFRPISEAAHS